MKVLAIGDVHLKPIMFHLAEKILDSGQADMAIQLGDMVDDWGEDYNIGLYERTIDCAIEFHKKFPNTLWVTGNHDYGYWNVEKGKRESGHSYIAEYPVLLKLLELKDAGGKQSIMHMIDDVVFTHAGLTKDWVDMRLKKVGYKKGVKPSKANLLHAVNMASPNELWMENSPIWVRPQYSPADSPVDMYPAKLQVVGHTPVREIGVCGGCLSTDTFSTYRNGAPYGDRKFAIIDTETGEWKEVEPA